MSDQSLVKPGAQLRILREQRGLTVEDISEKTLISLGKLKLLEDDRYSDVGIDLFVTGYIKKYSRIVGGDSDQLLADFFQVTGKSHVQVGDGSENAAVVDKAEKVKAASFNDYGHTKSFFHRSPIKKAPIWFVVIVVVAIWAITAFFMSDSSEQNSDVPVNSTSIDTQLPVNDELLPNTDINADELTELDNSNLAESDDVSAGVGEEEGRIDNISATKPIPDSIAVADTSSAEAELIFSFTDECWVSIKDGKGEILFAQLQKSGDNLQLSGIGPFDIQLGNARAAILRVDGEAYTIPVKVGHKTLRFSVTP